MHVHAYLRSPHASRPLRHARPLRPPRQPALPRRDDLRRRPRLGLQRRGVAADHRPLHRARRQLHRHRERLHEGPLREDHRRPHRPPRRASATALVIATKFSGNLYPGDPNGGGSSRKSIVAACEQSLRRLQTDYIDLYWLHNWDVHTPIEETMRALDDLVRAGKVRYIGVSDTPAWKVAEAQRDGALPRLVAVHRAADRVLAARAHRRGGARARWRASSASASRRGRRSRAAR